MSGASRVAHRRGVPRFSPALAVDRSLTHLPRRGSVPPLSPLFNGFPLSLELRNLLLVALAGFGHGLLRRPAQRAQEPGNVLRVVRDAELALDQRGHPLTGPAFADGAVRLRPCREQREQPLLLHGSEFGPLARLLPPCT